MKDGGVSELTIYARSINQDLGHGHNPLFGQSDLRGLKERPFKPRRKPYHRKGPRDPDRKPIENDPAFKIYIAKLNRPEKPVSFPHYNHCVAAAYYFLKSMNIPITATRYQT